MTTFSSAAGGSGVPEATDGSGLLRTVNEIRERLTASEFASDLPVRHRAEVLIQRLVDIFVQKVD